jgi:hypothetical protein
LKILYYIIVPFISLLFSNCSKTIYIVNQQNIPSFEKEKEFKASASLGMQGEVGIGGNLNMAYAIDNKFATIAGASFLSEGIFLKTNGFYSYLGIGYYKSLNRQFVFESYMGYGHGNIKNNAYDNTRLFNHISYHNFFNQSSITYKSSDNIFELAFSLRTNQVLSRFNVLNEYDLEVYKSIIYDPNSILLEPNLTFRVGFDIIKVEVFISRVIDIKYNNNSVFPQESIGVGLVFFLNPNEKIANNKESF